MSNVSNRQNDVMKKLTVIATVFLLLTFITGFSGQNFGFLVTHLISSQWTFWVVGIGSVVVTCVGFWSSSVARAGSEHRSGTMGAEVTRREAARTSGLRVIAAM